MGHMRGARTRAFFLRAGALQISPWTAHQDRSRGLMVVFGNGLAVGAKEERPEWSSVVRRARTDLVPRVDVMLRSCAGALVGDVGGVVEY